MTLSTERNTVYTTLILHTFDSYASTLWGCGGATQTYSLSEVWDAVMWPETHAHALWGQYMASQLICVCSRWVRLFFSILFLEMNWCKQWSVPAGMDAWVCASFSQSPQRKMDLCIEKAFTHHNIAYIFRCIENSWITFINSSILRLTRLHWSCLPAAD